MTQPISTSKDTIVQSLKAAGITNSYAIEAICANIIKESGAFKLIPENLAGYANTSLTRIRTVFSFLSLENGFTDDVLTRLKGDTVAFTDTVYGGRPGPAPENFRRTANGGGAFLGNSQLGDGFKYRGRGFIQITGKSNYERFGGLINKDLVNNPDLLVTDYKTSFDAMVAYLNVNGILKKRDASGKYGVENRLATQTFQTGIAGMNAFRSQLQANEAVTAAIGGSLGFLEGAYGKELLAKVNALTSTSGGVPSNSTAPSSVSSDYFNRIYVAPLSELTDDVAINFQKAITGAPLTDASNKTVTNPTVTVNGKTFRDVVESGTGNNGGVMDISGESILLGSVVDVNVELQEKQKAVLSRIDGLLPAEAAFAVQLDLFEFFPDKMREKMSINAAEGINSNYSHAWRSPGKLAITANLTIPGASGFRIGEIFWIGRTYEHYKQFGAFQLFGLTETIDLNRGWTTELYARFNAMPKDKISTATSV